MIGVLRWHIVLYRTGVINPFMQEKEQRKMVENSRLTGFRDKAGQIVIIMVIKVIIIIIIIIIIKLLKFRVHICSASRITINQSIS